MLLALLLSILGCFVVWKGMSVLSDTLSHGALSGLVGAHLMGWPLPLGAFAFGATTLVFIHYIQKKFSPYRTLFLTLWTLFSVSTGSFLLMIYPTTKDFHSYFLGDILLSTAFEGFFLCCMLFAVGGLVFFYARPLKAYVIDPDMASLYFPHASQIFGVLLFLMGLSVAMTLQLMGVLLSGVLLLFPPALARFIGKQDAHHMMIRSVIIALSMAMSGGFFSFYADVSVSIGVGIMGCAFMMLFLLFNLCRKIIIAERNPVC